MGVSLGEFLDSRFPLVISHADPGHPIGFLLRLIHATHATEYRELYIAHWIVLRARICAR